MQDVVPLSEYRMTSSVGEDSSSPVRHDASMSQGNAEEPQTHPSDDELMHEVLAMNTLAMQRCNAELLEDASSILSDAYMMLHEHPTNTDQQQMDALRSTTLNNLGVVECHRGQHRQALSHFEAARQLEEKWGSASPSVALNTCAAYNALGMYDKATAAATETIDMLRTLAVQEESGNKTSASYSDAGARSLQGTGITIAKSDNRALWGAAWHNLAVAQINTARYTKIPSEHSNAAVLFQNAMRATQELLGRDHPMTKSVTETYRTVRHVLRSYGVYKQHHTMLTVPQRPVDPRDEEDDMERFIEQCAGKSRRRAKDKFHRDLTITFCGEATKGIRLTERLDPTPYPCAVDAVFRQKEKRMPRVLRSVALSGTLLRAGQLYGNPHPLLYSLPPNYDPMDPPTMKESYNSGMNSYTGMESNFRRTGSAKKSPARQQKRETVQKSAFGNQQGQAPYTHQNAPSKYHQVQPPIAKQQQQQRQQHQQHNYQQKQQQYQQQGLSNHNESLSSYQQDSNNYKATPVRYPPTASHYYPQALDRHNIPTAQQQPQPQPQVPQPNYYECLSSHPPPSNNYGSSGQKEAPYKHQQAVPNQRQESPSHKPKSAGSGGEDRADRRTAPKRSTSSNKTRPTSRDPAAGVQSSQKFLPPLGKSSVRGSLPSSEPAEKGPSNNSNEKIQSFHVSHVGVSKPGPVYEQVKYVLLAEPQDNQRQRGHRGSQVLADNPRRSTSALSNGGRQRIGSAYLAENDVSKTHRLFDAMWVSSKDTVEGGGICAVGRPSYYVSSVVDMSKDPVLMPEEVMQMMMASTSSSEDATIAVEFQGTQ